uniref:Nebulin-related anchoring protein n=1 Tax=Salmo trutta TaxID=8032 RepID=A0A673X9Y0_SALTR
KMQSCARCGFVVYPAEKINCIDQNWHKACFHCDVCKMVLTAKNFVSHKKRPYCSVHNPRNNMFTSVYETPINAKKQAIASSEVSKQRCHRYWLISAHDISWNYYKCYYFSVIACYEGANNMLTFCFCFSVIQVEYNKGEEKVSKYTSVAKTPEVLLAKSQGQIKYRQMYEQEMKGKATSDAGAAEFAFARENAGNFSQIAYTEEYEQERGKGSFPAMITPAYQLAKKAQAHASDLKYKKDLNKMKGSSHFHNLTSEDNLALKSARKINKIVSEVEYKKDLENTKGHSINYCETPQYKNASKAAKFSSDNNYKKKYTNHMKGHYEGSEMDKNAVHAMNVRKLASNVRLSLQHIDQVKYSSVTDTPQIVQARINAQQLSNVSRALITAKVVSTNYLVKGLNTYVKCDISIKYKEDWEKTKSKTCDIGLDALTVKAAKASRDLASDIKYKESFMKNKDKTSNVSDSKTLHSLQASKMTSEIEYKKNSKANQSQFSLSMDMVNLSHAKKAQALASDLDYRTKLHHYTILSDDIQVQQAKKAYNLQSENQYRSDLTWMKGVGWEADGCLNVTQAKKAGELLSDKKYRQKVDNVKFTQVADTPSIKHAKKSQELQSKLTYKAGNERMMHQYTMDKDEPLFRQAKANADLLSGKVYKSSWEQQREKGFELRMDSLSILTAKAKRDLASNVKYKEKYEQTKGKMIGVKTVTDDSQMAHSALATRLQSDRHYRKEYEDTKTKHSASLDMLTLTHAKKAQDLATETNYRTFLHKYTTLPGDMKVAWAKKAYGLLSDKQYRSDRNWMKGVGWGAADFLDVKQAKKAGELVSEKKYRQHVSDLKFTSVEDTPEMVQAKLSNKLALDRLYREKGEHIKHNYTLSGDLPEHVQAKLNAMNISETRYKESWTKIRDGGYKLRLDAIPFQSAKASGNILSDHKYKEQFEKTKGHMIGMKGLENDMNMSHSVNASKLQSDIKYKQDSVNKRSQYHLSMDMLEMAHAKKAQTLASEQDYRLTLHQYTTLPDDMKVQAAKRAYQLQSEKVYRSDLNYLRGVAWISTGALQMEGFKRATDLISEKNYRQQPCSFKHTSVADSPDIVHAKLSNKLTNERLYKKKGVNDRHNYTMTLESPEITQAKINAANFSETKYRESWHTLRAQGYKLTMQDIPFQAAKTSMDLASDVPYKHNHLLDKGKHIGARSILDDPRMLHCMQMGRLTSEQEYRKDALSTSGQYHLNRDMINLVTAKNAQALASDQDYRKRLHAYTVLPDDIKVQWAKKAYNLQSEKLYKSDLNFMKGVAWDGMGAPQMELAKKAGELTSDKKYRQLPDSLKFTQVADSPDMVHAKNSYLQCSERLYKSGDSDAMHKYTLHADDPDFIRARINAQQISNKAYKASGDEMRSAGYDLRLDAIPFQTAKASTNIASDFRYKEAFVKEKGQQVGLLSVEDDPKMVHSLAASKLQSCLGYKRQAQETRSQFKMHADQPVFQQAKKSQALASNQTYHQRLHDYTFDPQQLNVQHAKQAYKLQSDVNYKSDLNWIRGVGWTPPGSHKVEMARRAAELGLTKSVSTEDAIAQYQHMMMMVRERLQNTACFYVYCLKKCYCNLFAIRN